MTRKKSLLIISFSLIAIAMIGGTSAYYSTTGRAQNIIATSGVSVEILETAIDDTGHVSPFQNIVDAHPGETYSKIPQVHNIDEGSAWVRIHISTTAEKDGTPLPVPADALTMDFNTSDWTQSGDYYYYNTTLDAGELTPPIFTNVVINPELPDEYQSAVFSLTVTTEAVQAANNGTTPLNAGGWND